jgi:hypothetical protein
MVQHPPDVDLDIITHCAGYQTFISRIRWSGGGRVGKGVGLKACNYVYLPFAEIATGFFSSKNEYFV